jgi:alkylation response protein AidB-like acyl-CoA dehydrogenase
VNFDWTAAQLALRDRLAQFAGAGLPPALPDQFSRDRWKACAQAGILGLPMPAELGGAGLDAVTTALAFQTLASETRDAGLLFLLGAQIWLTQLPLLKFAGDDLRARYLPKLISGDLISCAAMTEPDSGSDAFSLRTTARFDPTRNGYFLNGRKIMVTGAPVANLALVFATVDPAKGRWGVTAFLVEAATAGLTIEPHSTMGRRNAPMAAIHLDDVFVPAAQRLGDEGSGAAVFEHSMRFARALLMAADIGIMERQWKECSQYVRQRRQFNQPIRRFQSVSNRLADMRVRLETARLLVYHAAWLLDSNGDADLGSSMAKLYVSEAFVASSLDAIRIHGGHGYLTENKVEADLRDAVGSLFFAGAGDIQRLLISTRSIE